MGTTATPLVTALIQAPLSFFVPSAFVSDRRNPSVSEKLEKPKAPRQVDRTSPEFSVNARAAALIYLAIGTVAVVLFIAAIVVHHFGY